MGCVVWNDYESLHDTGERRGGAQNKVILAEAGEAPPFARLLLSAPICVST